MRLHVSIVIIRLANPLPLVFGKDIRDRETVLVAIGDDLVHGAVRGVDLFFVMDPTYLDGLVTYI